MKRIFTVQHPQSEHHVNGMVASWTDWELTELGREVAERIYERHILLTRGLIRIGVDPVVAEQDACRIEHDISRESFDKLKDFIAERIGEH